MNPAADPEMAEAATKKGVDELLESDDGDEGATKKGVDELLEGNDGDEGATKKEVDELPEDADTFVDTVFSLIQTIGENDKEFLDNVYMEIGRTLFRHARLKKVMPSKEMYVVAKFPSGSFRVSCDGDDATWLYPENHLVVKPGCYKIECGGKKKCVSVQYDDCLVGDGLYEAWCLPDEDEPRRHLKECEVLALIEDFLGIHPITTTELNKE